MSARKAWITFIVLWCWQGSTARDGLVEAQSRPPAGCSVRVAGDVPADTTLSPQQLRALPQRTIKAADHGRDTASYAAIGLGDVLRAAGARIGRGAKGAGVAQYIVVRAADGYRAVYSVAEVDSAMTSAAVWLAVTKDGGPLGEDEGPCRMLVPGDRRHARWVRQVTAIELHLVQ